MSRALAPVLVVLWFVQSAACGSDDAVNPSNPEAAAKDASSGDAADAAKTSDGGSSDAPKGGPKAAADSPTGVGTSDAPEQ
jgi:hypothetical protein